jgi:polyisoprenoid-binding protein YceI
MKVLLCALSLILPAGLWLGASGNAVSVVGADASGSYQIDPVHSSVVFGVKHLGVAWFYGTFNEVKGSFTLDEKEPAKSSVEIEIPVASIDTRSEKRDGHLKSADFFSADEFPTIRFKSTKVAKANDGYQVDGDLALHGVTKPVSFVAALVGTSQDKGTRTGFGVDTTIRRSEFGMTFMLPDGLGDEVRLLLGIEGTIRQAR